MLSSMTGFGRAVSDVQFGKLTVEIQSINRKYLEILVSIPREFSRFEHAVRGWVGDVIARGGVSVRIFFIADEKEIFLPDMEMLRGLKKKWGNIALELGIDPKGVDLPFLMQVLPVQSKQDMARDEDLEILHCCVNEALQSLLQMRQKEGEALAQDLSTRLQELERMMAAVVARTPDATKRMQQKLFDKMQGVLRLSGDVEERLLREVALFAERVDVAEEITRFHSHMAQFRKLLQGKNGGRTMDFLLQEIGREVNTIGAKSMEAPISHLVVELKSELERMREQIQNIE